VCALLQCSHMCVRTATVQSHVCALLQCSHMCVRTATVQSHVCALLQCSHMCVRTATVQSHVCAHCYSAVTCVRTAVSNCVNHNYCADSRNQTCNSEGPPPVQSTEIHCRGPSKAPLSPILICFNPVHSITLYFPKMHFNIRNTFKVFKCEPGER